MTTATAKVILTATEMTATVTMAMMTTFHIIFYIITIYGTYGNIVILHGTQLTYLLNTLTIISA